jgi:hypothetical protein
MIKIHSEKNCFVSIKIEMLFVFTIYLKVEVFPGIGASIIG